MARYEDVGDLIRRLESWGPTALTKLGCACLYAALQKSGQKALYIQNQNESQPLVVVVGKDDTSKQVAECVHNWAKEKGLVQ